MRSCGLRKRSREERVTPKLHQTKERKKKKKAKSEKKADMKLILLPT